MNNFDNAILDLCKYDSHFYRRINQHLKVVRFTPLK